jgi:hypothetical protein
MGPAQGVGQYAHDFVFVEVAPCPCGQLLAYAAPFVCPGLFELASVLLRRFLGGYVREPGHQSPAREWMTGLSICVRKTHRWRRSAAHAMDLGLHGRPGTPRRRTPPRRWRPQRRLFSSLPQPRGAPSTPRGPVQVPSGGVSAHAKGGAPCAPPPGSLAWLGGLAGPSG